MALSASTFSNLGGAVNDLFAGFAATTQAGLKAQGLNISAGGLRLQAQGTRIGAEGTRIGAEGTRIGAEGTRIGAEGTKIGAEGVRIGAEGTRLTAESMRLKAAGDIAEASNYDLAAGLARQNIAFTEASTRIKTSQLDRQVLQTIGGVKASVAGGGLTQSGSALDVIASSASQGALARNVLIAQGGITEAGFEEQAKSYETMAAAGRATAAGEYAIADRTDIIAGRQMGLADRTDLIAGRQMDIANRTDLIANREMDIANRTDEIAMGQERLATQTDILAQGTISAGKEAATGSFISSAIKGVAAIASIGLAPFTGGASLLALPAIGAMGGSEGGGASP
jgi:hypothetical protein